MSKTLLAALLLVSACAAPHGPAGPVKQTIPAGMCGVLVPADGVNAIKIGTHPNELSDNGCAPADVGKNGCTDADTDIEFIVSEDFTFYPENADMTLYPADYCWSH